MKISFSTLGCPGWSWDDMIVTAKDLGFDGIEIRGIGNELYVPNAGQFNEQNLQATKARLDKLDIKIPCLASACYLFEKTDIEKYLKEGKDYIELAQKLGTPYIRVLGDRNPEKEKGIDLDFVAENLTKLADYAVDKKVRLLVETNGVLADSSTMKALLEKVARPNVGVLWDVHHPYRFFGETIEKTYSALKDKIEYVHVKDSVIEAGKVKYKMMGYGDVPVKAALETLKAGGYEGYVSLEWVKRWCMDLEEPGVVFSHFINYIRGITE